MDCFVAFAPLRKRFAFVADNDMEMAAPHKAVIPANAGIQYAAAYPRHCERSKAIHLST